MTRTLSVSESAADDASTQRAIAGATATTCVRLRPCARVTHLTLIIAATKATLATRASHGIDLIDENYARCGASRLCKQIPHARCADAHEHFDEVGA
jgi:hypothetical protein